MRLSRVNRFWTSPCRLDHGSRISARPPLIHINDATFYRRQPSPEPNEDENVTNPPLYKHLNFQLPADSASPEHYAIVGPSNAGKTTFLEILRGQHLCFPPTARSYPYLNSEELLKKDSRLSWPARAVQYVGFSGQQAGLGSGGSYLSARYETRRESTDFSLLDFLLGKTQLNAVKDEDRHHDEVFLGSVLKELRLENLLSMPLGNLSNGQTRRARIAKALLGKPELLLLDEPFMGLDPPTTTQLNPLLRNLAHSSTPRLLLALRSQDPIPDWITKVLYLGENTHITHEGTLQEVTRALREDVSNQTSEYKGQDLKELPRYNNEFGRILTDDGVRLPAEHMPIRLVRRQEHYQKLWDQGIRTDLVKQFLGYGETGRVATRDTYAKHTAPEEVPVGEPLIEMDGVTVRYGDKAVLGNWDKQYEAVPRMVKKRIKYYRGSAELICWPSDQEHGRSASGLRWSVCRGQRWAIIGPNGSGKTTLLSLITSDHPQAYALPMKLFGRSRLPKPGQLGLSLFDIQKRIGHASPEVHSFFPKHLSVRATLESAFAETPLSLPSLDARIDARIDACLRWFQGDLNPTLGPNPVLQNELLRTEEYAAQDYARSMHPDVYDRVKAEHYFNRDRDNEDAVAWADDMRFSEMTLSGQRVALFLRAIIAQPDIVILDEAFSGMDDVVRDKCILFFEAGETKRQTPFRRQTLNKISSRGLGWEERRFMSMDRSGITITEGLLADHQSLIVVSHVREEIPSPVSRWLYLPEGGGQGMGEHKEGPVFATGGLRESLMRYDAELWEDIWNIPALTRRYATQEDIEAKTTPSSSAKDFPSQDEGEAIQLEKKAKGRPKGAKGIKTKDRKIPKARSPFAEFGRGTEEH